MITCAPVFGNLPAGVRPSAGTTLRHPGYNRGKLPAVVARLEVSLLPGEVRFAAFQKTGGRLFVVVQSSMREDQAHGLVA
jgi:hypothetical protein